MKRYFVGLLILLTLTGCWDSKELDNTGIVHGVGFKKSDDQLCFSVEIIKPVSDDEGDDDKADGEHIVLEQKADTLLEGARDLIKFTKRRLNFSHSEAWIINDELAKESFVQSLDIIQRDQMLRLSSFLFITPNDPTDILNTPTLYDDLVSIELASTINNTKYIADYTPITIREFYKKLNGPVGNAYVPIIQIEETGDETLTSIDGTAVINNDHMVGKLNKKETFGLNVLLNHIEGGNIKAELNDDKKVSLEISALTTKTTPQLKGKTLDVAVETKIEGTLADNITEEKIDETFINEVEKSITKKMKESIQATLNKLQKEFKTDIANIGPNIYRKHPKKWRHIQSDWDDIFAGATVSINVDTKVTHQGLINESINRHKQPFNNPYLKRHE